MENKFYQALQILKPNVECSWGGVVETEEDFKKVEWKTGEDSNGQQITTTTCPHSEITWTKVNKEMKTLQSNYDNQDYARNRLASYPSLQEFAEAYCEKEVGDDSTKWDAYVVKYNKVRSDNPKE
jgi:hypothetical protein